MKIIHSILFITLFLCFCSLSFAGSPDDAFHPPKCPSVTAIKAGGIGLNPIFLKGEWYGGRRHMYYDTKHLWSFILGPIVASSSQDAYAKAVLALTSLTFLFGPNLGPLHTWQCEYNTIGGMPAVITTPPLA